MKEIDMLKFTGITFSDSTQDANILKSKDVIPNIYFTHRGSPSDLSIDIYGFFSILQISGPQTALSVFFTKVFGGSFTEINNMSGDDMYIFFEPDNTYYTLFEFSKKFNTSHNIKFSSFDLYIYSKIKNRKISTYIEELINFKSINRASINRLNIKSLSVNFNHIKNNLSSTYLPKWQEIYDIYDKKYDFLKPFDITLDETSTDSLNTTVDRTESNNESSVQGFNSSTFVPTDKNSLSTTRTYSRQNPKTRTYTRSGNIGNTSLSELAIKERDKALFNIRELIYEDIIDYLCRNAYSD